MYLNCMSPLVKYLFKDKVWNFKAYQHSWCVPSGSQVSPGLNRMSSARQLLKKFFLYYGIYLLNA